MWGIQILDKVLKIHEINVYSIASEIDIFRSLKFYQKCKLANSDKMSNFIT